MRYTDDRPRLQTNASQKSEETSFRKFSCMIMRTQFSSDDLMPPSGRVEIWETFEVTAGFERTQMSKQYKWVSVPRALLRMPARG